MRRRKKSRAAITLDRYAYGLDLLGLLNFSGTMLLIAFYNPTPSGAAAVFSLACFNIAGILMIRRKELVRDIENEQRRANQEGSAI